MSEKITFKAGVPSSYFFSHGQVIVVNCSNIDFLLSGTASISEELTST